MRLTGIAWNVARPRKIAAAAVAQAFLEALQSIIIKHMLSTPLF